MTLNALQKDIELLFDEGVKFYEKKLFRKAEAKFKKALEIMPEAEDVMYNLALVYLELNRYDLVHELAGKIKTMDIQELTEALNKAAINKNELASYTNIEMPTLASGQKLDLNSLRHHTENFFLGTIFLGNIVFFAFIALLWNNEPGLGTPLVMIALLSIIFAKINYSFLYWILYGNSVLVSSAQYPEIYEAVTRACDYIDLKPIPSIFVLQGHGRLDLYLIRKFTARGYLIFTSDIIDKLLHSGDSRELMMMIGRQLGHIKLGHYKIWILTDVIGKITGFFYLAWKRRCNLSADRVGLLVTGNIEPARKALLTMTAGRILSNKVNIDAIREQDSTLRGSTAARFFQLYRKEPYMIHRLVELRKFKSFVMERPTTEGTKKVIAALPPDVSNFNIHVHGQAIIGDEGIINVSKL